MGHILQVIDPVHKPMLYSRIRLPILDGDPKDWQMICGFAWGLLLDIESIGATRGNCQWTIFEELVDADAR